jgi:transmembrane protein
MELTGFQPTWLVAALTIAVLLAASALIIFDRLVWLGAGMLAVFTVMTILLVHDFWNMSGLEATLTLLEDEEHLTVIGGLIIVAIHSFWRKERGQSQRL